LGARGSALSRDDISDLGTLLAASSPVGFSLRSSSLATGARDQGTKLALLESFWSNRNSLIVRPFFVRALFILICSRSDSIVRPPETGPRN
jgi:hypothetical protein